MSLILDALRRAESGRGRDLGQRLAQPLPPHARRKRRGHRARWFAAAGLAATGVVAFVAMTQIIDRPTVGAQRPMHGEPFVPQAGDPPRPVPELAPEPALVPVQARGSSLAEIALPAAADAPAPLLLQLPDEVRRTVPALTVNAHFWSADPARRFIVLDMRRYRDGDVVRDGLRVVRVDPAGAELEWRGTRFRVLADAR